MPEKLGGRVCVLLGNHELMVTRGEYFHVSQNAFETFKGFGGNNSHSAESDMKHAYSGNSKYALWLRKQNTILKIGDSLFVHGGLDQWVLNEDPGKINATVRAWMAWYQGMVAMPHSETKWVVKKKGPLWTRRLARHEIPEKVVDEILKKFKVKRIIIGHTRQREIATLYNEKVYIIDTSMSGFYSDGVLSCLEIKDNHVSLHYLKRLSGEHFLKKLIKNNW